MKLHIAECDDWIGLYVDGKLVQEGHSLHWSHLLETLNLEYTSQYYEEEESMEKMGYNFPEKQEDLIDEKRE